MLEVLTGQFFWGVVVGLLLSFVGGWTLARVTISMTQAHQKRTVVLFCADTVQNIRNIVLDLDRVRDRARIIHHDFMALIEIEVQIYGRNREHLIHLPDDVRGDVREFMNGIAIKRAEVMNRLEQFGQSWRVSDQLSADGQKEASEREREKATAVLQEAHKAVDRLATLANGSSRLLEKLTSLK